MGRVVHFEIAADDPDRAANFYRKAFGLEVADFGGPTRYLLATTGPEGEAGINGAITGRAEHGQAVVNTIDVENWEEAARAVRAAGGRVLSDKSPIPGVGTFAYCVDTEGNVFGILEAEPAAAAEPVAATTGTAAAS